MKKSDYRLTCDLHTHSTFSDGTKTPTEIVREAKELGLYAVALTDHNTTSGLAEFAEAGKKYNVKTVCGVEFSTDYGEHELHIVALFIDEKDFGKVNLLTEQMRQRKEQANRETVAKLCEDGYLIDYDEISAGAQVVNRAHIATALMKAGYVASVAEAFDTLLSKSGKYYTQAKRLDALETISFITSIGAVSVLAHPLLTLGEGELRELLPNAKAAGLCAMEVEYSTYDEETRRLAHRIAEEYGLLKSGGSDYHGERKPDISLGIGRGELRVPKDFYLKLRAARPEGKTPWRQKFNDAVLEVVCELLVFGVFLGIGALVLALLPDGVAKFFDYDYELVGLITIVALAVLLAVIYLVVKKIRRKKAKNSGDNAKNEP